MVISNRVKRYVGYLLLTPRPGSLSYFDVVEELRNKTGCTLSEATDGYSYMQFKLRISHCGTVKDMRDILTDLLDEVIS